MNDYKKQLADFVYSLPDKSVLEKVIHKYEAGEK